nr:hypothetical protein [Verrucomicrobiota bacterium]
MKQFLSILATTLLLSTAVPFARAEVSISVDFFHEPLASHGSWMEVGDYGYCWQPRDVAEDWRPYSDGRWVYTDAGWTWDSDEPYGWAVYHYGRWTRLARVGWVWVPGTEWGPAWVSWRRSPRHVGWAPLPPEARFRRSVGFSAWVDSYYDIGPSHYSFVEVRNFGAPRLRTVIVAPRENITIINQTTNITKITYVNNVVYNEGPQYEVVSRESAQPIRRLTLERRVEFDGDPRTLRAEQLQSRVEGNSLRVVAPRLTAVSAAAPKRLAAKVESVEIDRGWKDAGPAPEVAKLRTKLKAEAKPPAELPPQPKFEKAADEPVASEAQTVADPAAAPAGTAGERMKKGGGARTSEQPAPAQPEAAPASPRKLQTARPGEASTAEKPPVADPASTPAKPAKGEKAAGPAKRKSADAPPAESTAEKKDEPVKTAAPASESSIPERKRETQKGEESRQPRVAPAPAPEQPASPATPAEAPRGGKSKRLEAPRPAPEALPATP